MADEKKWDLIVTWRIEDYSSCLMKTGEVLASPVFPVEALDNSKWHLAVYPGGWKEDDKESLTCFLYKEKDNISKKESNITYEFQISTADKKNLLTYQNSRLCKNGIGYGPPERFKLEKVVSEIKKCCFDVLFIQCSIKNNDSSEKLSLKKELRTRILSHKCSFEWNVKYLERPQNIKGQKSFHVEDQIYQISIAVPCEDVVVTVKKLQVNTLNNIIVGKIALLDVYNSEVVSIRDTFIFDAKLEKMSWEFPSLITKKLLTDRVSDYVKDGNILLLCEFSLYRGNVPEAVSESNCNILGNLVTLSNDFRRLMVDKTNLDVKLFTKNNVEVKAHRTVLAARSPVFSAMFNQDMIENQTGVVTMDDVDSETLESFLEFLYTGILHDLDNEKAIELLLIADKYQVPNLKEVCAHFLMSALSVDNVCEILTKADMMGCGHLKSTCLDFAAHHVNQIFSTPNFSNWVQENSQLSVEITLYVGKLWKQS